VVVNVARFDHLKGVFGLLPSPYQEDYEIHTADLRAAAGFCCRTGQHGIVWPVMGGEFYFLGEEERIRHLDIVLEAVNGRLPVVFGCSGVSVPQALLFARAAQRAGVDAIIAMAPAPPLGCLPALSALIGEGLNINVTLPVVAVRSPSVKRM
jgi:4-hydroxy-tetrahydrodipicolinate synthase